MSAKNELSSPAEKRRARLEHLIALVETAVFIALAFVLSFVTIFKMPQGGSVTPVSMLPILLIGIRRGKYFGFTGALVYAGLQMMQGWYPPPAATFWAFAAAVMLDYVIAFGALGLSSLFPKSGAGFLTAIPVCCFVRFLCHYLSGILIWASYAEDMPAWLYSLIYNGQYMLPETLITMAVAVALIKSRVAFFGIRPKTA